MRQTRRLLGFRSLHSTKIERHGRRHGSCVIVYGRSSQALDRLFHQARLENHDDLRPRWHVARITHRPVAVVLADTLWVLVNAEANAIVARGRRPNVLYFLGCCAGANVPVAQNDYFAIHGVTPIDRTILPSPRQPCNLLLFMRRSSEHQTESFLPSLRLDSNHSPLATRHSPLDT